MSRQKDLPMCRFFMSGKQLTGKELTDVGKDIARQLGAAFEPYLNNNLEVLKKL